jgi:hypothetical protein
VKRSIAVVSEDGTEINKLHVNYWAVRKGTWTPWYKYTKNDAIDFGFDIPAGHETKYHLILPVDNAIDSPKCLIEKLTSNVELLNALFNETCTRVGNDNGHTIRFSIGGREVDFIRFGDLKEESYKSYRDYNSIAVNVPESDVERYVRFRIKVRPVNAFSQIKSQFSSFFETMLMRRRIVDFRVNSRREFVPEFQRNENYPKIKTVHFFFIHHSDEFVDRCNDKANKERFLETSVWDQYAPKGLSDGESDVWEALHSKKELKDENSYSLFLSSKFRSINFKYLSITFVVTFFIGLSINFASTFFIEALNYEDLLKIIFSECGDLEDAKVVSGDVRGD